MDIIVVSTNVAEASVTLPDVTVVIDSCRVKEIDFDGESEWVQDIESDTEEERDGDREKDREKDRNKEKEKKKVIQR